MLRLFELLIIKLFDDSYNHIIGEIMRQFGYLPEFKFVCLKLISLR
jgi:hypothetical protein